MLVYAGCSPEDEIPDSSNLYMIIADLSSGIGNEIYFFFDDEETFLSASDALELGFWSGFNVVPHSRISFRPSNQSYSPYYTPSCEAVNPPGASGESQRPEDERRMAGV